MRQINSQLTRDKVVAELRRDILYGVLTANQELYQDKIAEELGVSRMPVREALQILSNEGLVNVRPNKVATVNDVSEKFIRDHFSVRALLEKEAIGLATDARPDCTEMWNNYALAEKAIARQIGARGLRAIMEEIMTKIMFEIPSDPTIQSVCITERCVRDGESPQITRDASKPRAPIKNAGVTL